MNAGGTAGDHVSFRFWIPCPVPEISAIEVWSCMNFACSRPPISLGEAHPDFLELHYKAHPDCDHVAKFRGDRPRELGGSPANKKGKKHLR